MKCAPGFVMLLGALAVHAPTSAQAPGGAGAMRALNFLAGRWEGTGTMMRGPDQNVSAHVIERAEFKLQGNVLVIEGRGTAEQNGQRIIVHDALGVISHDSATQKFVFQTWRAGETMRPDIEIGDRRIVWGFNDARAGRIRFTVTIDEVGRWHEVGEFSRDGANWTKFMEMRLTKVSP